MKILVALALVVAILAPATAFAGLKVLVFDSITSEERTFLPADNADFRVPVPMGGWSCSVTKADSPDLIRWLECARGDSTVSEMLFAVPKALVSLSLGIRGSRARWLVTLKYD